MSGKLWSKTFLLEWAKGGMNLASAQVFQVTEFVIVSQHSYKYHEFDALHIECDTKLKRILWLSSCIAVWHPLDSLWLVLTSHQSTDDVIDVLDAAVTEGVLISAIIKHFIVDFDIYAVNSDAQHSISLTLQASSDVFEISLIIMKAYRVFYHFNNESSNSSSLMPTQCTPNNFYFYFGFVCTLNWHQIFLNNDEWYDSASNLTCIVHHEIN